MGFWEGHTKSPVPTTYINFCVRRCEFSWCCVVGRARGLELAEQKARLVPRRSVDYYGAALLNSTFSRADMGRHYSVTITVGNTRVEPDILAERLAGLVERGVDELRAVIEGHTVVLQDGLSYREATEIQRELSRRKIPSQVTSEDQLQGGEPRLQPEREEAAGVGDERGRDGTLDGDSPEREANSQPIETAPSTDRDGTSSPEEDDEERASPMESDDDSGAWGELFPDLADEPSEPEGERSASGGGFEDDREQPEHGGDSQPPMPEPPQALDALWSSGDDGTDSMASGDVSASDDAVGSGIEPEPDSTEPDDHDEERDSGFEAGKIHRAFAAGEDERPPYAPDGYDDRPEHVPLIAAILSVIAPGAGQVYNGRLDKGRRRGATFFLVYPWYKSIREAWTYGEKVRTYYAPRPEKGSGTQAMWYGLKWWLVVAVLFMATSWTVSMVQDYLDEQQERRAQMTLQQLRYNADQAVENAVSRARTEAENAEVDVSDDDDEGEYTMDDEERARRLFILGYHYCKGGEFQLCAEMMGRVTSVAPSNRDAFSIQTWANLRAQGVGEGREMPDVDGQVPTLADFEVRLAAEGQELADIDDHFGPWWEAEGREAVEERHEDEEEQEQPLDSQDEVDDALSDTPADDEP